MMIKVMTEGPLMDDNSAKGCRIIDDVGEVNLMYINTGEAALQVTYKEQREGMVGGETFILKANIYLMNDSGKTIQTFSPNFDPAAVLVVPTPEEQAA